MQIVEVAISFEKSVGEEVAYHLIATAGEVDAVGLRKGGFAPLIHGSEAAHHLELIPHGTTVGIGQAVEDLSCQGAIGIDGIGAFLYTTKTIVVGDKHESTRGADAAYSVDELLVLLAEHRGVKTGCRGIVDAYAEDHHVGLYQLEVFREMRATEIVSQRSSVDSDTMVGETRSVVSQQHTCEGKGLPLLAWQDDGEGIGGSRKVVVVAVMEAVDTRGYLPQTARTEQRHHALRGMAQQHYLGGSEVKIDIGESQTDDSSAIGGGDGNAAKAQRLLRFFVHTSGEIEVMASRNGIVVGVVALARGRIGEEHAATGYEIGIGAENVAANGVGQRASLHMGAAYMHDGDMALIGMHHTLPASKEPIDSGAIGRNIQMIVGISDKLVCGIDCNRGQGTTVNGMLAAVGAIGVEWHKGQ